MSKDTCVTIWVPLAQVRISERRRRAARVPTVELYRQWLEQGRQAPPVSLVRQGDWFLVRDGRHRVAAALAAGHLEIEAKLQRITSVGSLVTLLARLARAAGPTAARALRPRRVGNQPWG